MLEWAQKLDLLLRAGATLPPPVVFFDGTDHWIGDGHHRIRAAIKAGLQQINVHLEWGSRQAAVLHAVGADPGHGLRRTDEDKRRAVLLLLEDELLSRHSNRTIARRCRVTESTVRKLRDERAASSGTPKTAGSRTRKRDGTTSAMVSGANKADRRPKPTARTGHADVGETAASTPPTPQGVRPEVDVTSEIKSVADRAKRAQAESMHSGLKLKLDCLEHMFNGSNNEDRRYMLGMLELFATELADHWSELTERDLDFFV